MVCLASALSYEVKKPAVRQTELVHVVKKKKFFRKADWIVKDREIGKMNSGEGSRRVEPQCCTQMAGGTDVHGR